MSCPCCGNNDYYQGIEELDVARDDDGSICYWEFECQECGCIWSVREVTDIIRDGMIIDEDEEEEE